MSDSPAAPSFIRCGFLRMRVRHYPAPDPSAPTILALHGFSGSGRDFDPLRRALSTRVGWICPDWPGHGESDAPEVIDPYLLPSCMAALDRLAGLRPATSPLAILGYSMGGRLAWHWLLRHQGIYGVLLGASPGMTDPSQRQQRRQQDQHWIRLLRQHGTEAFCHQWEQQPLIAPQTRLPEPLRSHLRQRRRAQSPIGLMCSLKAVGTGHLPGLGHRLKDCPPAWLIAGARDDKFSSLHQSIAARYPQFTPLTIRDAGHSPHLDNPSELARCLTALFVKAPPP